MFLVTISFTSFGQKTFTRKQLDTMINVPFNHCDQGINKFGSMILGEEPMCINYLKFFYKKDFIELKGQITDRRDNTSEIPDCQIFYAIIIDTACYLEKISQTDKKGNFNIKVKNNTSKSLYFSYFGYHELELKLKKLQSAK